MGISLVPTSQISWEDRKRLLSISCPPGWTMTLAGIPRTSFLLHFSLKTIFGGLCYLDVRTLSLCLKKRNKLSQPKDLESKWNSFSLCHLIENKIWEVKSPKYYYTCKQKEFWTCKITWGGPFRFCCLKLYENTNRNERWGVSDNVVI